MKWQPIDTAPKDEAILVAGSKRMGVCVGRNDSRDGWETETPSEWVSIYPPTHWMPLPDPPGNEANQQELPEAVVDAVAAALGNSAYDCTRVWSAWSYGTMGPDDFAPIAEDGDRVAEIARAALDAMKELP